MVGGAGVGGSSRLTGSSEPPKRRMLGHWDTHPTRFRDKVTGTKGQQDVPKC